MAPIHKVLIWLLRPSKKLLISWHCPFKFSLQGAYQLPAVYPLSAALPHIATYTLPTCWKSSVISFSAWNVFQKTIIFVIVWIHNSSQPTWKKFCDPYSTFFVLISHHICLCKQNYVLSIKSLLFPSSKSLHLLVPEALLFREISSETLIMKRKFFVWGKYVTYKYWQGRMKLCYGNSWQVAGPPHPTLFLVAKLSLSYLSQWLSSLRTSNGGSREESSELQIGVGVSEPSTSPSFSVEDWPTAQAVLIRVNSWMLLCTQQFNDRVPLSCPQLA